MKTDGETVANLKKDLKWEKESVRFKEGERVKWMNYAFDLQAKLDYALDRLTTIAEGRYFPSEIEAGASNKDQKTAIISLKKIARMQERRL